jgi:hypothetical protein
MIGTVVTLSSKGHPNSQMSQPFFFNFLKALVHLKIATMLGDALPSLGVNPLEGSPKCNCGKLGLGRRSRLPTL